MGFCGEALEELPGTPTEELWEIFGTLAVVCLDVDEDLVVVPAVVVGLLVVPEGLVVLLVVGFVVLVTGLLVVVGVAKTINSNFANKNVSIK